MPKRYAHLSISECSDNSVFAHDIEINVSFVTKKDREAFKRAMNVALKAIENGAK